jgi:hypothetical protein
LPGKQKATSVEVAENVGTLGLKGSRVIYLREINK